MKRSSWESSVPGLCLHSRFLKPKWTDRQERESLCRLYGEMFFFLLLFVDLGYRVFENGARLL